VTMENMEYFYELYTGLPRGGPGDNMSTRKAFSYMSDLPVKPLILDIGCGPGMQTIELAKLSRGSIIALDNYQPFLDDLMNNAKREGFQKNIIPKLQSMHEMDFEEEMFDVIWSEGALYFLGFKKGLNKCYRLLKPDGYLAVTEAVYLKPEVPQPVIDFWKSDYPDIKDISSNIELIKQTDFDLLSHFTLPDSSWIKEYYTPLQKRIKILREKYVDNKKALSVFDVSQKEIDDYKKYSDFFGYEFFVMKKNK
ncbi:MAG TPA: class I SAM-dependent methyltransferase, partial [Candidatus Thermoplasmatota archaeon]|nr:class I SAM-dependent methyltransferase [Candidatus Thermoplasmatota archaeon]